MEKTVRDGCSVIMRQHARTTHPECIRQNGNRDCRSNDNDRTPEPVTLYPAETLARSWTIGIRSVCKVSEHHRERDERHQRSDAAASLDDFELLGVERVQRFQLDDVALAQHGNAEKT